MGKKGSENFVIAKSSLLFPKTCPEWLRFLSKYRFRNTVLITSNLKRSGSGYNFFEWIYSFVVVYFCVVTVFNLVFGSKKEDIPSRPTTINNRFLLLLIWLYVDYDEQSVWLHQFKADPVFCSPQLLISTTTTTKKRI